MQVITKRPFKSKFIDAGLKQVEKLIPVNVPNKS
jgi:hypothetical protein